MNIDALKTLKKTGEKFTCLTAYDASFAKVFDHCGIEVILIGDSLGNVIQGDENTLGVSMQDMLYHTQNVAQGVENALLISDMPYKSYENPVQALLNAQRLIEAGAAMVKFEGGVEHEGIFKVLQKNKIPVCAHLGLQPQSVIEIGGYKVQGRDENSANQILSDAKKITQWGADIVLLECIPSALGKQITQSIDAPTIGIGAGVDCDGQILVSYDMLGVNTGYLPKFVKNFLTGCDSIECAVKAYIEEVKNQTYPADEHSY